MTDDEKSIDDDEVGMELGDLIASIPKQVEESDLETEEERLAVLKRQAEEVEEKQSVAAAERVQRQKIAKQKVEDRAREKIVDDEKLLVGGGPTESDIRNDADENVDDIEVIDIAVKAEKELPPLPDYVQKEVGLDMEKRHQQALSNKLNIKTLLSKLMLFRHPMFLKNKSKIGGALLFIVGLLLASLVHSLFALQGVEKNREQILYNIQEIIGRQVEVGQVDFILLPPHFVLKDLKIKNNSLSNYEDFLTVDRVELVPSFLQLIFGSLTIEGATLINPVFVLENYIDSSPNWKFETSAAVIEKKIVIDVLTANAELNQIRTVGGRVHFLTGNKRAPVERIFHSKDTVVSAESFEGPYRVNGVIAFGDVTKSFDYDFELGKTVMNEESDITMLMDGNGLHFEYIGKMEFREVGNKAYGNVALSFKSPEDDLIEYFSGSNDFLHRVGRAVVDGENGTIVATMTATNSSLQLDDIVVDLQHVKAKSDVKVLFGDINKVDLNLQMSKLNLDVGLRLDNDLEEIETVSLDSRISDVFSADIFWKLDVDASNITYNANQIGNVSFDGMAHEHDIKLNHVSLSGLPGSVDVVGDIAFVKDKNHLAGSFEIKASSAKQLWQWLEIQNDLVKGDALKGVVFESPYVFKAGVLSLPSYIFVMPNLGGKIFKATGAAEINKVKKINLTMTVASDYVDVDRFLNLDSTLEDENVEGGEYEFYDWLRRVRASFGNINLDLKADVLKFRNQNLRSVETKVLLDPEKVKLMDAIAIASDGEMKANIAVDTSSLVPKVYGDINLDTLDTQVFKKYLGIKDTKEELSNLLKKSFWSDYRFDLKMFNLFEGAVEFNVGVVKHRDWKLTKVMGGLIVGDHNLTFKAVKARMFGGSIKLKGKLDTAESPIGNWSMTASNVGIKESLNAFFGGGQNVSGRMNFSSALSMKGYSMQEWLSSMAGDMRVISRGAEFSKSVNIRMLAARLPQINSEKEALYWIEDGLSKGVTGMDYIDGYIKLARGVVTFRNIPINDSSLHQGILAGNIDMKNWKVNVLGSLLSAPVSGGFKIPFDFSLKGDINNPVAEWNKSKIFKAWQQFFFKKGV